MNPVQKSNESLCLRSLLFLTICSDYYRALASSSVNYAAGGSINTQPKIIVNLYIRCQF